MATTPGVVWPSVTSALLTLPGPPPQVSGRGKNAQLVTNYLALDVNDAGVIAGGYWGGSARWRPMGNGYADPELLPGYSMTSIDDCGRVLLGYNAAGVWGPNAGDGVTPLPALTGFTVSETRGIASDPWTGASWAVGSVYNATLGYHAVVWKLSSCTP